MRRSILFTLLALSLSIAPKISYAATYNVPAGNVLELILAIDAANANPGYDKIVLAGGSNYAIWAIFGENSGGLPTIESSIEITVPDDADPATIYRPEAADSWFRLFNVSESGTLRLDRIIVRGGKASSAGAIHNEGTLVVERSRIEDNTASHTGGIRNDGNMSITDSTIVGNASTMSDVGGILNVGNAVIERSTFTENWANRGAGALGNTGYCRAVNTTFSGNNADVGGGAIVNNSDADLWLESVTVTENTCDYDSSGGGEGGGVLNAGGGNFHATNSLIAGNFDNSLQAGGKKPDVAGTLFSHGYNLIGDGEGMTLQGNAGTCLVGYEDLFLGPLADNGGWTLTHALLPGSPAIDNGNPSFPESNNSACESDDQRGYSRAADGDGNGVAHCDIGAFERGGNRFVPPGGGKVVAPGGDDDGGIDDKLWNPNHGGGRDQGDGYVIVDLGDSPEPPVLKRGGDEDPQPSETPAKFRRGDVNASGDLDMADAVRLLNWLFLNGDEPTCQKTADANDDGSLDVADVSRLLNFLYLGGDAPPAPNMCGWDETKDKLTCEAYTVCATRQVAPR